MAEQPVIMHDGSIFRWIEDEDGRFYGFEAFVLKVGEANVEKELKRFKDAVQEHWQNRTVMTKFGQFPWKKEYKDHAELGRDVMYAFIRAALFSVVLQEHGISVIALGEKGTTVYKGTKTKKVSSIDDALSEAVRDD